MFKTFIYVLTFLLMIALNSQAAMEKITQPSVSRRALVCDQWQWIGNGATTWGCLTTPREVNLAGGQITDEVIVSLQDQINKLEAQLKKLK